MVVIMVVIVVVVGSSGIIGDFGLFYISSWA